MTLHTRAATEEVLDMFNQTLRNVSSITDTPEGGPESDDEDDDYTSGGESTGTGRVSEAASEYGDETKYVDSHATAAETDIKSVSPWSDFTRSKHVPNLEQGEESVAGNEAISAEDMSTQDVQEEMVTPVMAPSVQDLEAKFIPDPPNNDIVVPTHPFRDLEQANQSRLPFMTPIVELTEGSIQFPSSRQQDYFDFNSKTPSRPAISADPALSSLVSTVLSSAPPSRTCSDVVSGAREYQRGETRKISGN